MMRNLLPIFFICFCICESVYAQTWDWAQRLGNTQSDKVTSIKTDTSGNVFIAGYFSNSITLGTNGLVLNFTANAYSKEAFVAKLDSNGYCLWARSGGQYFDDRVLGMAIDQEGNSVITGTYWTTGSGFNMGPIMIDGSTLGWGDNCFLVKHDPDGNALWGAFVTSESGDDQGLDVAISSDGNIYVVGFMTASTLYCNGTTVTATNPNTDVFPHCYWLAKVSPSGVFQWARTFGNLPWDSAHAKYVERDIAVSVDDIGGVYVTGGFDRTNRHFGTETFDTYGGFDIFAMKYDTDGNFQWAKHGGSDKDDWSSGISADKNGHVYITGEHRDSLIMDSVVVKNFDKRDVFVIKMDASTGTPIWGKRAGSDLGGERGNDIIADTMCNIYVAGDINEGASFGSSITTPMGNMGQAFVAKISPDGDWQWVVTGGETGDEDRGNAIAMGKGNQVYTAGYFRNSATYGGDSFTSAGSSDGFFAKIYDESKDRGVLYLNSPGDTVFCVGEMIELDQPDIDIMLYSPVSTVTANADLTHFEMRPTESTTYTFIGSMGGNCPAADTVQFNLIFEGNPVADFSVEPLVANSLLPEFDLINHSTGAVTYQWSYDNHTFSSGTNAHIEMDSAGHYCFRLIAISAAGCRDTTIACGDVKDQEFIAFPNVFTPNKDGENDFFTIYSGAPVTIKSLQIYNRWGDRVYALENSAFFGKLDTWDGIYKDLVQPIGSYTYMMDYTIAGKSKIESGMITILH